MTAIDYTNKKQCCAVEYLPTHLFQTAIDDKGQSLFLH